MGAGGIVGYRKASRVSIHAMLDRKITSGFRPERRIPSSTFAGNRSRTEIPDRIGHECGTGGGTGRLKEQLGIEFADDREVLPQPGGFGLARSRKRKAGPVRLGKSSVFSTMMCVGLWKVFRCYVGLPQRLAWRRSAWQRPLAILQALVAVMEQFAIGPCPREDSLPG